MPAPAANPRIRIRIAHTDPAFLVVNKMPGVVTEPGRGHRDDSLMNGLMAFDRGAFAARLARLGEARDWGLLHRLDRLTSGLVLVALEIGAYDSLREAFESRSIAKRYLAIVRGALLGDSGECDAPLLERADGSYRTSAIDPRGKPALTRWSRRATSGKYHLLECELVTGRLHQIRVHLASIGAPVAGDPIYEPGGVARGRGREPERAQLCLHAWQLAFAHPVTREPVCVRGQVPRRFATFAEEHGLGPALATCAGAADG